MHPLKVAAQYAAYTWYLRTHPEASRDDALWFAKTSWDEFLAVANEGLGRLLIKMGSSRPAPRAERNIKQSRRPLAAAR